MVYNHFYILSYHQSDIGGAFDDEARAKEIICAVIIICGSDKLSVIYLAEELAHPQIITSINEDEESLSKNQHVMS